MLVKVHLEDILEIVYWARRYCDGRSTYAPSSFNARYQSINYDTMGKLQLADRKDDTLMNQGEFWPYAQDGMYEPENSSFDARPTKCNFIAPIVEQDLVSTNEETRIIAESATDGQTKRAIIRSAGIVCEGPKSR